MPTGRESDSAVAHTGDPAHTGIEDTSEVVVDADRDGFVPPLDCDDSDAMVHPGASDPSGDALDADCDGVDGIAGAFVEGPWANGEMGRAIDVSDIDGDGLDDVVAGIPAEFTYSYDTVVQAGAVAVLDENLVPTALLHGPVGGGVGQSVGLVPCGAMWCLATFATDGEVRGGVTYVVELPAPDGARLEDVALASIRGVALGLSTRRIHTVGHRDLFVSAAQAQLTDPGYVLKIPVPFEGTDLTAAPIVAMSTPWDSLGGALVGDRDGALYTSRHSYENSTGQVFRFATELTDGVVGDATHAWEGLHISSYFGLALAVVEESSRSLLAIGAPGDPSDQERGGRVYVVDATAVDTSLGGAVATIHADVPSRFLGWALHSPGDVDGDGHDDLLVGAPGDFYSSALPGRAYLFLGPLRGDLTLDDAAWTFYGTQDLDGTGSGLASGDFDGDGLVDLLVGRRHFRAQGMEWAGRIDRVLNTEIEW